MSIPIFKQSCLWLLTPFFLFVWVSVFHARGFILCGRIHSCPFKLKTEALKAVCAQVRPSCLAGIAVKGQSSKLAFQERSFSVSIWGSFFLWAQFLREKFFEALTGEGYKLGCRVLGANQERVSLFSIWTFTASCCCQYSASALGCSPHSLLSPQAGLELLWFRNASGKTASSSGMEEGATWLCGLREGSIAPTYTSNQPSCFQPTLQPVVRNTAAPTLESLVGPWTQQPSSTMARNTQDSKLCISYPPAFCLSKYLLTPPPQSLPFLFP